MAYASKYYDPVKAHEYYMRTRELKGYENRYGGSRGDGTSAASGGGSKLKKAQSTVKTSSQKEREYNQGLQKKTQEIRSQTSSRVSSINSRINDLRNSLNRMSPQDKKANREAINDQIAAMRKEIQAIRDKQADSVQALREKRRGGSTSGFNQKGKEAAKYIKSQMENERKELTKKTNKELDSQMLSEAKKLKAEVEAMRASGRGFSRQQFLNRITGLTRKTKQTKNKTLSRHKAEYKQKYKDEIDKLRQDKSMYSYYDSKAAKMAKRAEAEKKQRKRNEERAAKKREQEAKKRERAANRKRR